MLSETKLARKAAGAAQQQPEINKVFDIASSPGVVHIRAHDLPPIAAREREPTARDACVLWLPRRMSRVSEEGFSVCPLDIVPTRL